jgi:putative acetyltransferase
MNFAIRRAGLADLEAIAAAHVDSIRSLGAMYYEADVVRDWAATVSGRLYADAMAAGEVFFVAVRPPEAHVLGFSSHRVDDGEHGVSVYVRGEAARRQVGTALLRAAEAAAIAAGATSLSIDASLAALDFYKKSGFVEVRRAEHRLASGRAMPCVVMRKPLR